jgi:protein SCO1/2
MREEVYFIMKFINFIGSMVLVILVLSGCSNYQFKETMNVEIEDFDHINQKKEEITLKDLKGKPWLAMFIFTNCRTICPPMTFNMAEVQQSLENEEGVEDYNIVAFSVDPDVDTPEVLSQYLSHYTIADESKWQLLTGYNQLYIEQFAKNSFNTLVKNDPSSDQVIHMSHFYLVNAEGVAVKSYNGNTEVPIETIVHDIKELNR